MHCGAPTGAATPSGARPIETPRAASAMSAPARPIGKIVSIALAGLLLAAAAGYLGWRAFVGRTSVGPNGGQLLQASGSPLTSPLTERQGKVAPVAPVTTGTGVAEQAPAEVIDYLAFLKEIERERVLLRGRNTGEVLRLSTAITAGNLTAEMSDNPEQRHSKTYDELQSSTARIASEWQALSARFLSKPAPASCAALRDRYYDMLGKSAGCIAKQMAAFGQALAPNGDPASALKTLGEMNGSGPGSASYEVKTACDAADDALAAVCNQYRLRKDFEIRDDGGGGLSGGLLR
jgi:hypothetical protein